MSVAAAKVGAPIASASTARLPATGRSAFAAEEAMPIGDLLATAGTGPDEQGVRDDEWDERGHPQWNQPKARRPIIASRFVNVLTTYDVDRFLFQVRMVANDPPVYFPVASAARRYEINYVVLRYGSSLHGRHYNHLH